MALMLNDIYDFAVSMWAELFFVGFFAIGFAFMQAKTAQSSKSASKIRQQFKNVHAEAVSGKSSNAVAAWRAAKAQAAASCETLKLVTQAFLDCEPCSLVQEVGEHFSVHASKFHDSKAAVSVLEVIARAGNAQVMDNMFQEFTQRLHIPATPYMQEVLLGGYATAGDEKKVAQLVAKLRESRQKVTVRGHSLMIKGFLKNGMIDAALMQITEMRSTGMTVSSYAVTELFRAARDAHRAAEVFKRVCDDVPVTSEAATIVLEDCLASQDVTLAKAVEKLTRQAKVQISFGAYEALLKLYAGTGDVYALELFEELQRSFPHISDGFCVSLISKCAEPKFVRLAEKIVAFQRSRKKMTMITYSALMKVYSHCSMYSEACDLYDQVRADGLEPDSMMYGCLMRFSAQCGRTDLTRELFSKVQGVDIHHHMALIRAAGQDKDTEKAFAVLEELCSSGVQIDVLVYNSVVDVCCSAGDMKRAHALVTEMRKDGLVDTVSYNTLLKGYSMCQDVHSAKAVISEMEEFGLPPNEISYNCLINVFVSSGDFHTAFDTIETMERKGIPIDHYTVSTMMKALKHSQTSRNIVGRVMALLDRHGIDVCCEEVLLNTTIEALIKHGEHQRLQRLAAHAHSKMGKMHFAMHTYATVIRAYGILKRVDQCWEIWTHMTEVKGLVPSGVALGCMLDALVCSGGVVHGLDLLRKWQDRVQGNTVIFSTLIKGFAAIRDAKRADELWQELRAMNLPLNTIVYNAIIDAHARVGALDKVTALVESMSGAGCVPDDITMSMVAKAYCMTGDLDKALEVFRSLPAEPNANTVVVFNTILDGCVRHNRFELADAMLENMELWRVYPTNVTLGTIVKMWGRRRQLDRAFEAVKTLPKRYRFTPNGPVQTCLLFSCLRNDALDSALMVLQDIRAAGLPVDSKVFTALVSSCTRAEKFDRAVALVEEAYGLAGAARVIPSREDLEFACLEQLMKSLSKKGLLQKIGVPLLNKMRTGKVTGINRLTTLTLGRQDP